MRKVREVLRLKYECGRGRRDIAASVGIGGATVSGYINRAAAAGLTWEKAKGLSDAEVEALLFQEVGRNEPLTRRAIDFGWVHRELSRAGVTLQTLWVEYRDAAAAARELKAYEYSRFCDLYAQWRTKLSVTMRQVHRAGEKLFIDYSGKKPRIVDKSSGEVTEVELFVAVMGASNYTFAEATRTQKLADFVGSTVRTFEYLGGVPEVLVPDQLRSAVSGPDRYEPDINPTYLEMAQHYDVTVIPARPRKPRDKAKVEGAVLIVQRWIIAALRHRTFFSLAELNQAIAELLERLNNRPFQKLEGCRRSAFETIDKPVLRRLPTRRYELADWKHAKVNIDYCVSYELRLYSVPHALVGQQVEIRATSSVVEILHKGTRVASHRRSYAPKGASVIADEHRPRAHREYGKWPPERIATWAASIGPHVGKVVTAIMSHRTHPETGYRASMGVIRLKDRYGDERVDAACRRALHIGSPTFKSVNAILKNGLDRAPLAEAPTRPPIDHDNIRGGDYFNKEDTSDLRRNDSEADRDEVARDGSGAAGAGDVPPDRPALH
ncbi:MAG: IS21 family transposase [Gemmatimonadaceae bacterium]|nr:IS21 family transposase [Gemmatimonadaceae bacterium]